MRTFWHCHIYSVLFCACRFSARLVKEGSPSLTKRPRLQLVPKRDFRVIYGELDRLPSKVGNHGPRMWPFLWDPQPRVNFNTKFCRYSTLWPLPPLPISGVLWDSLYEGNVTRLQSKTNSNTQSHVTIATQKRPKKTICFSAWDKLAKSESNPFQSLCTLRFPLLLF